MRRVLAILIVATAMSGAHALAAQPRASSAPAAIPFDSLFRQVASVRLDDSNDEPLGVAPLLVEHGAHVVVVDRSNANLKVFDRATGRFIAAYGRAGNGPGESRRVVAIERDRAGNLYTLDGTRNAIVVRDSAGRLLYERVMPGSWTAATVVHDRADRLVLTGRLGQTRHADGSPASRDPQVLHEVDSTGVVSSVTSVPWPSSSWQMTFANYFSAAVGQTVITGSYLTDTLRFRDWTTGRTWAARVVAPWMKTLRWPAGDQYGEGTKAQQLTRWASEQTIVSKVFAAGDARFVTLVQSSGAGDSIRWSYVVGQLDGASIASSTPTPFKILRMAADTAFSIREDESGSLLLETRVLRVPVAARRPGASGSR